MSDDHKPPANRTAEQLDVQLLDVLAQIEALLRHGREIQRAALTVRGIPDPVSSMQRRLAGKVVGQHIEAMRADCHGLIEVLDELSTTAAELNRLLGNSLTDAESSA